MKKLALTTFAGTALIALAACSGSDTAEADDAATDGTVPMATEVETTTMPDEDGTSISVDENGMSVDVNDGDTSVSADTEDGMSASVETK